MVFYKLTDLAHAETRKYMKRILVCEDDLMMQKAIVAKLTSDGYDVRSVGDGQDAINTLEKEDFDLVLTDLHMPHVTGMEIIDYIKTEKDESLPVLVLSKDTLEDTVEDAYSLGVDDFINKPLRPTVLSVKVKKLLSIKR